MSIIGADWLAGTVLKVVSEAGLTLVSGQLSRPLRPGMEVSWSAGQLVGWSVGRLVNWLAVSWSAGRLVSCGLV